MIGQTRQELDPARVAKTPPEPDPFLAHPVARWLLGQQHRLSSLDGRHPWLFDSAGPVTVLLFSLPQLINEGGSRDRVALILCVAAVLVPLWWRRRAPSLTFFTLALVLLVEWSAGFWNSIAVGMIVALYNVALRSSMRVLVWAAGVTSAQLTFALYVLQPVAEHRMATLLLLLGTNSAGLVAGLAMRTLRAYLAAQADRTAWLETERDQRARLTAADERARIAREMHDLVGHHVSIVIGLADGGAALARKRGESTAAPLQLIAATGRQALNDLRRVLGVLRDEGAELDLNPQPGITDLERLLPNVRAAGLAVSYRTTGELFRFRPGLQLAVYRIVQESLTNTLKHAGAGASAKVTVTAMNDQVTVCVTDSGPADPTHPPEPREPGVVGQHGLVGMRERAGLYGGTVTAGPNGRGGWHVEVTMNEDTA